MSYVYGMQPPDSETIIPYSNSQKRAEEEYARRLETLEQSDIALFLNSTKTLDHFLRTLSDCLSGSTTQIQATLATKTPQRVVHQRNYSNPSLSTVVPLLHTATVSPVRHGQFAMPSSWNPEGFPQ